MWGSALEDRRLTFRLIGINNQNFIMQDDQTGTWWQQVTGEAILGPLKGRRLALVAQDQLTFAKWKEEAPSGRVLRPDARIAADDRYQPVDWEQRMARYPAPAAADRRIDPRALVVGVAIGAESKAYPVDALGARSVTADEVGGRPIAIVRDADGRSTRVFDRRVDGRALDLFANVDEAPFRLADAQTGSEWDFTGTAVAGPLAGRRLARVPFLEEYWFDWNTYHPSTELASRSR